MYHNNIKKNILIFQTGTHTYILYLTAFLTLMFYLLFVIIICFIYYVFNFALYLKRLKNNN